jgi:leucyl-tRNA synthetase
VVPAHHRLRRRAAGDIAQLEGGWPERVLTMQRNWIGRSEGAEIDFTLEGTGEKIRVFTTRVDTIYGATCVILAPEHPLVRRSCSTPREGARQGDGRRARQRGPRRYRKGRLLHRPLRRQSVQRRAVPIWIGNFVLMGYGTGAIMAVPAHDERDFEFCRKYGIAIRP